MDVQIRLLVTDARVIIYCDKWTKSGGWIGFGAGGMAVALAANAVSKARASSRRKGKLLVGHVRYHSELPIAADRTVDTD